MKRILILSILAFALFQAKVAKAATPDTYPICIDGTIYIGIVTGPPGVGGTRPVELCVDNATGVESWFDNIPWGLYWWLWLNNTPPIGEPDQTS